MESMVFRQLFLKPPNGKPIIIDDPQFVPRKNSRVKVNGVWFQVKEVEFEVIDNGQLSSFWACQCFLGNYHHESSQQNPAPSHRRSRPYGPRFLDRNSWSQKLRKTLRRGLRGSA